MIAPILIAIIASFTGGAYVGYKYDQSTIEQLQHTIDMANIKAEQSRQTAETYAAQVDKDYEQKLNSIQSDLNTTRIIANRLRVENNKRATIQSHCSDSSTNATTEPSEFSEQAAKFLSSEARRADQLAIYADSAYQFIKNNCGIK